MITRNGCKKIDSLNKLPPVPNALYLLGLGRIVPWFQLVKLPVCLLVAFSSMFGAALPGKADVAVIIPVGFGMLCLACGGATLNSLQEIRLDATMARTKDRPLPKGSISASHAVMLAVSLIMAGLFILYGVSGDVVTVVLGLGAVVFYNFIYTYLKPKTVAAIIPGAVSGALPPYIGWTIAGGAPFALVSLFLGVLFVLWQVPHTLLILLCHKEDYLENDIPSLVKLFPESSLKHIFLFWIGAFFAVLIVFTLVLTGLPIEIRVFVWVSATILFLVFSFQLSCLKEIDYYYLFIQLNGYLFLIMAVLIFGKLFF